MSKPADLDLLCIGCLKPPSELPEYIQAGQVEGMTPDEYCWQEEGTLNNCNGHFLCTICYVDAGCPSREHGRWIAP